MKIKEIIVEAVDYNEYAKQVADKFGVPFSLVQHAMNKETGHLPDWADRAKAVSRVGARGVMQLMPKTAKSLGVADATDPKQNIEGGVKYLSQLYNRFGDPVKTLAAYNTGPGNLNRLIKKYGDDYVKKLPRETKKYVAGYSDLLDRARRPDTVDTPPSRHPYRDMATTALATVTGARDAYGADQPPRAPAANTTPPAVNTTLQPQQQTRVTTAPPVTPSVTTAPSVPTTSTTPDYTIRKGQTLSSIAKQHGTTVDQIMSMNPSLSDPNKISTGATIKVNPQ